MLNAFKTTIKWIAAIVVICLVAYVLASVNGLSVSREIGSVGNVEITEAEYKYYLEMTKDSMLSEAGVNVEDKDAVKAYWDSEIDGKKASEVAKEDAKKEVLKVAAACAKAEEAGITLTDEQKAQAESAVKADTADMKKQLDELKKATGADEQQLIVIMEKTLLASAYAQNLSTQENSVMTVSDEEAAKLIPEKYARVKHVLIQNTPTTEPVLDENGNEVAQPEPTEEELAAYQEEAKKKADEVLAKAVAGEDFEGLIAEYGEDPGMESTPDGYVIDETGASIDGQGAMVEPFTKGSFAVEVGNVNPELVESDYGWHIIKRYPIEPTAKEEAPEATEATAEGEVAQETPDTYTTVLESARQTIMTEKYDAHIEEVLASLEVTFNDKIYNKIKVK